MISISAVLQCQKAFTMLPDNRIEVRVIQNNQLVCHYGRKFVSSLIHRLLIINNLTDSRGILGTQISDVLN